VSQKKRNIGKTKVVEKKELFGLNEKQRSRLYTIIFFIVVGILFIINNSSDDTKQGPYPPNYNQDQGELLKLEDLKGKVVLVDFWATWCPPCREGIPDLVLLKEKYKNMDVEIVGISVDAITRGGATAAAVVPFMQSYKINYPIVRSDEITINSFGNIHSIPTSFLIDKDGNIVARYEGVVSKDSYIEGIEKILNNNYDKTQNTKAPNFSLYLIEKK
jgi:cytochrome c biogenesis protein CcmG/thiol:disulfide interchange protein DsbE